MFHPRKRRPCRLATFEWLVLRREDDESKKKRSRDRDSPLLINVDAAPQHRPNPKRKEQPMYPSNRQHQPRYAIPARNKKSPSSIAASHIGHALLSALRSGAPFGVVTTHAAIDVSNVNLAAWMRPPCSVAANLEKTYRIHGLL